MGYRTTIARYVAKWGIAQMCLCETKCQGGGSHRFGGALNSLKTYRAKRGYRSDSIAVSHDMGPLSLQLEASCLQWSLFAYSCVLELFLLTIRAFLLTIGAFLLAVGAFLLTLGNCV